MERIVEGAARLLGSTRASFWLQDAPDGDLRPRAAWGYASDERSYLFARSIPASSLEPYRPHRQRVDRRVHGRDEDEPL